MNPIEQPVQAHRRSAAFGPPAADAVRRRVLPYRALLLVLGIWLVFSLAAARASAASYSFTSFGERFNEFPERGVHAGEAGVLEGPVGVGVDGSGDVYVADELGDRIDKFGPDGKFLLAWGWGVLDGKAELQVCTTTCHIGLAGSGAGQLEGPQGVAVAASGDVYVFDRGNNRVDEFGPDGEFLLMFGGEVDKTTHAGICTSASVASGDLCGAGVAGGGNGEFAGHGGSETAKEHSYIAVGGPGGDVYVGDKARVQIFEPSGVYVATLNLSGLSSEGLVAALAVDPAGDVFLKIGAGAELFGVGQPEVAGVREFVPSGSGSWTEAAVQFDAGSQSITAIAVDGSGHLFVADAGWDNVGFSHGVDFHVIEYGVATGEEVSAFGFGTAEYACGIVYNGVQERLYSSSIAPYTKVGVSDLVWGFTPPESGPLIEPGSETATPAQRGSASFEAAVNPEGASTEVSVQYVDEAHYKTEGFAKALSSSPVSLASGFADQHVQVNLAKGVLVSGVAYHYRVVAVSPPASLTVQGTGPDQSFEEVPAALVEGPWATRVTSSSVTLSALMNPESAATSYRLEYGTSTSYEHVISGGVGEGEAYVPVSYHLQNLSSATTYHYRLVTTSVIGTVETQDHTFTTQLVSGLFGLLDGRSWELVSPADKHGAVIGPHNGYSGDIQAAADGSGIGYVANEPLTPNPPGSDNAYLLSTRGANSWVSREILPSQVLPRGEGAAKEIGELTHGETFPMVFAPDMSRAVIEPNIDVPPKSLSDEATERTIFTYDTLNSVWTPLVTPNDIFESNTKFGGEDANFILPMQFLVATPDLSHVVFESPFALTQGAESLVITNTGQCKNVILFCQSYQYNLYEWSGGGLQQVNILPDGKPVFGAYLGGSLDNGGIRHISDGGRWVVWEYEEAPPAGGPTALFVRDMVQGKTVQLGDKRAVFETMSGDGGGGSRIFYLDGKRAPNSTAVPSDLYEYDTATGVTTDVTANHGTGEVSAGVLDKVLGASSDGSYVYFVASGVLAQGAVSGQANLYVAREEGGVWRVVFVAQLSGDDARDWSVPVEAAGFGGTITSRVSGNGRFVAFMSDRSLTGYDNRDAVSGKPDEELYEYDAQAGRVVCVSCNPTGARPAGVFDTGAGTGRLLVDPIVPAAWGGHWLAASISGWRVNPSARPAYQPRNLSDSGRLFFESPDGLVPRDTNGLEDVYEFEPEGVGGCTSTTGSGSQVYVGSLDGSVVDGCVGLISSGTSSGESAFYDASETGDDAFFATAAKLVGADYDNSVDVYDAHVCSTSVPCRSEPVTPPECKSEEACRGPASAQPTIFGSAPSATFSGIGNVTPSGAASTVTSRSLTSAQKLAMALKACKRKRNSRQRSVCERTARKRYRPGKAGKTAHRSVTTSDRRGRR